MYRLMFWCLTKSTFQNVSHGLFLLPINGIYPFLFKSLCEKNYPLGESENYRIEPKLKNTIHAQISLWPLSRSRIKTIDKKVITRMQNYALFISKLDFLKYPELEFKPAGLSFPFTKIAKPISWPMKNLGFAPNFYYDFKYMYSIEFQKYIILFLHSFSVVERVDWRSKDW